MSFNYKNTSYDRRDLYGSQYHGKRTQEKELDSHRTKPHNKKQNYSPCSNPRAVCIYGSSGRYDEITHGKSNKNISDRVERAANNRVHDNNSSSIGSSRKYHRTYDHISFPDKKKPCNLYRSENRSRDISRGSYSIDRITATANNYIPRGSLRSNNHVEHSRGNHTHDNEAVVKSKAINRQLIVKDISPREFFKIWDINQEIFSHINTATFWHRLAKHSKESRWNIDPYIEQIKDVKKHTTNILDKLNGQQLANITWAFATLEFRDDKFTKDLKDAIADKLRTPKFFNGQNFANIAWAFAKLEFRDDKFTKDLKDAIAEKLRTPKFFNGQGLANIAWAFATLEFRDDKFTKDLKNAIAEKLRTPKFFNSQEFANIAWAFAKLEFIDDKFTKDLKDAIAEKLRTPKFFNGQDIANIAWAFAKLEFIDDKFTKDLKDAIAEKLRTPKFFNGQDIANIAWAFATLEFRNDNFIKDLKDAIAEKLRTPKFFNSQGLANIAWAFVITNVAKQYPDFINALLLNIEERFKSDRKFRNEDLHQNLQVMEILQIEIPNINNPWSKEFKEVLFNFRDSLIDSSPKSSRLHNNIYEVVQEILKNTDINFLNCKLYNEKYVAGFLIDIVLEMNNKKIAIEVCGPCHYFGEKQLKPEFKYKQRILKNAGFEVIIIPYFYWDTAEADCKNAYLASKILETMAQHNQITAL